ncbi:hypothetical protein RRG08_023416 [Elysia crispata]|uniref:Secreted protein n=1 Tax=Elysia crispata TaxID=231223 RepID=A0AAE0YF35_9GAST|nr:hypothetical protein RRG08_023416 [Elysia crispata]
MRFLFTTVILSLVPWSAHGDGNSDCVDALQRCYDYNAYAMQQKLDADDVTVISDGCMLYSMALQCMNSLDCPKTTQFKQKMKKLKKDLYKETKGLCLENGQLDDCFYKLIGCYGFFVQADEDLKKHDSKAGCLEVANFEKCTEAIKAQCPAIAVSDVYSSWEPLNKDAHNAGCDVDCNKALQECSYEIDISDPSDKDEYCSALTKTKDCLKKTVNDVGCSSTQSQDYLQKAVKQKASKYASQCNGVPATAQTSMVLLLVMIAASLVNRNFSQ